MRATATNPFVSEYVIRRLLNPAAVEGMEPRGATLMEWRAAFGIDGERCAETWTRHAEWLREAARQREIQPIFGGRFFVEALAHGKGL